MARSNKKRSGSATTSDAQDTGIDLRNIWLLYNYPSFFFIKNLKNDLFRELKWERCLLLAFYFILRVVWNALPG